MSFGQVRSTPTILSAAPSSTSMSSVWCCSTTMRSTLSGHGHRAVELVGDGAGHRGRQGEQRRYQGKGQHASRDADSWGPPEAFDMFACI